MISRVERNIHLNLAGAQGRYSVTWGEIEINNIEEGTCNVTLNYYDDTSASFVDDDIYSLSGNTYNNVVSIYFYAHGIYPYMTGVSSRYLANSELSAGIEASNKSFWSISGCGTITLGDDLEITLLGIDLNW